LKTPRHSLFWVVAIILLLFNGFRTLKKDWNYADPIDFRGVYIGTELLAKKLPLYNDSLAASIWLQAKEREGFESNSDFGDQWVSIMTYPPQTYVALYPFQWLNWKWARVVWWVECISAFLLITWLCFAYTQDKKFLLLIPALSASFFALSLGQPSLVVLALVLLGIFFLNSNAFLAGIAFGLASIKFTVLIPLVFWLLVTKKLKVLGVMVLVAVLFFLPALIIYPHIVSEWLSKASAYYEMIYQLHPQNIYTFSNSEFTTVLGFYTDISFTTIQTINLLGQLIGFALMAYLYLKKKLTKPFLLLGLTLVSFVFAYHLSYDILFFLVPLVLIDRNNDARWWIIIALIIASLPINYIAGSVTWLKFNYAMLCAVGLVLFIFATLKGRLAPHNSPIITA
jgi:hypothetical protein